MSDTDRFVGMITAVMISVGGAALVYNQLKKPRPDAYHRCRYVKHRLVEHRGSCCCQKIQFIIEAPITLDALDCESKIRYPHACISPSALNICIGNDQLGVFTTDLNGAKATCYFCACCGVHVFRIVNESLCHVNIDLVDKSTVEKVTVSFYDGSFRRSSAFVSPTTQSDNPASNENESSSTEKTETQSKQSSSKSPSETNNNQSSHSTNILAVQIYGAFADLKRENAGHVQKSAHSYSTNDRFYELADSNSTTPEKPSRQKGPSPSPPTSNSFASESLVDDHSSSLATKEPSSPSAFSGTGTEYPPSSRCGGDRARPNYSPPSLEQLRKLANAN